MIHDEDVNEAIGARVREKRKKKKLTQQELADLSDGDFTQTAIAMYERGERAIVPARLVRLAELLGCSPAGLLPRNPT